MRTTLHLAATLAVFAGIVCAQLAPNTLSSAERKQGWRLLFDGRTLSGWTPHSTSVPGQTGNWTVADGAMVCPGTTAGWISTPVGSADYTLKLEFRGAATVNSGVFLRALAEGQPHITGYELQIWDHQPAGFSTGSLVGSAKAAPTHILGEKWNKYEITVKGDHYRVVLNGATVLDASDAKHTGAGLVGFQCQTDNRIEFRNIKLLAQ